MSDLPEWIDQRIDPDINHKLTQRHVVETMLEADRPFFSIQQLQSRLKPDVSKGTVRNRLNELREIDVVAAETYPESITLYYINHPDSNWPLSPEGKRALESDTPLDGLSLRGFVTLRDSAGIRTLVLAGFQLSLLLFALGIVLLAFGVGADFETSHALWNAAILLFFVCLGLLLAERAARKLRAAGLTEVISGVPLPSRK